MFVPCLLVPFPPFSVPVGIHIYFQLIPLPRLVLHFLECFSTNRIDCWRTPNLLRHTSEVFPLLRDNRPLLAFCDFILLLIEFLSFLILLKYKPKTLLTGYFEEIKNWIYKIFEKDTLKQRFLLEELQNKLPVSQICSLIGTPSKLISFCLKSIPKKNTKIKCYWPMSYLYKIIDLYQVASRAKILFMNQSISDVTQHLTP